MVAARGKLKLLARLGIVHDRDMYGCRLVFRKKEVRDMMPRYHQDLLLETSEGLDPGRPCSTRQLPPTGLMMAPIILAATAPLNG